MPKETLNVSVSTLETEFDMKLKSNATGKDLFDTIVSTTGIRETWYFGLNYTDALNQSAWLLNHKKIQKQKTRRENPIKFVFKFKYFPENVTEEVIQDVTLRLLFKQIKSEVLNEGIYCPAEKAVLLASYAAQAKFGDFGEGEVVKGYLANEKILPPKILSQHTLSIEEWEDKISQFHQQHKGQSREEAMMEYLKIAQNLEMFGITYFPVYNAKGTEVLLGVDALGINFYDLTDKFNPKVSFPWSEIQKVSAPGKKEKFKIKFTDRASKPQVVRTKDQGAGPKIFFLANGNNEMYKRRRLPDPLDVQQMKAQRDADRAVRERERAAFRREVSAREKMEKEQEELQRKYQELESESEDRERELREARETIERLERALEEARQAKEDLERQQGELREMVEKLEHDREMEAEEKARLEEEIREKQAEVEEVRARVEAQEGEAHRLQEEMEEAKIRMENATLAMQSGAGGMNGHFGENGRRDSSASSAASSEAASEAASGLEAGGHHGDDMIPSIVVQKFDEEDREPDVKHEEMLKELRSNLGDTVTEETEEDRIYRENLSQGRDKFKTLREVRRGNTKRRVDAFENM